MIATESNAWAGAHLKIEFSSIEEQYWLMRCHHVMLYTDSKRAETILIFFLSLFHISLYGDFVFSESKMMLSY